MTSDRASSSAIGGGAPAGMAAGDARSVVWIASYPKSGNTWLRFLIANLVFGAIDSAAELGELIPDIHELPGLAEPPGRHVLMKTHFPCSDDLPLGQYTRGAIYVVRDPADVMVSNFHYSRRRGGFEDGTGEFHRYADEFIAARGDPQWLSLGMGTWLDNVASWLGTPRAFPVLPLRYEDVLADAAGTAGALCRFLGLERKPAEIAAAVAGSSFKRMREVEERDIRERRVGIFYKPYLAAPIGAGMRFMRSGRRGEAGALLSPDQQARFAHVFGVLRQRLGYA